MSIVTRIILTMLLISGLTIAHAAGTPPFKKGQIAVKGATFGVQDLTAIKYLPLSDITVYQVENGKELGQVQRLRKKGIKAGLNYIAQASATPNDPLYSYQWHMKTIQMEQAWDISKGAKLDGSPVVVAVLDTGIKGNGTDGVNLCATGWDVVNNDSNPTDGSDLSHGTHVAGTIAQRTNFDLNIAGTGVVGVAPSACVLPVKVLDDSGSGSFVDIAEGIYYSVNYGAKVINMSLGVNARYGITSDSFIDPALDYAEANNVLVAAAAGNDSFRKNVSYPAIYDSVVAVGATDYANKLAGYSNRGTGLDIMAPGGNTSVDLNGDGYVDGVLQETFYTKATVGPSFGYYFLQGTSMATPHVAGLAALLYANGLTNVNDVRNTLFSSSKDLGSANYDSTYGYGLIQAFNALTSSSVPPVTSPPSAPSNLSPNDNAIDVAQDVSLSWLFADNASSYDVYLGTASDSLQKVTSTSSTSYGPLSLAADTLYYWQIVAVNNDGSTAGQLWSFTTLAEPVEPPVTTCIDADLDGFCANEAPLDCDDTDAHINPGMNDTKGRWGRDGVDNNCNGLIDG